LKDEEVTPIRSKKEIQTEIEILEKKIVPVGSGETFLPL